MNCLFFSYERLNKFYFLQCNLQTGSEGKFCWTGPYRVSSALNGSASLGSSRPVPPPEPGTSWTFWAAVRGRCCFPDSLKTSHGWCFSLTNQIIRIIRNDLNKCWLNKTNRSVLDWADGTLIGPWWDPAGHVWTTRCIRGAVFQWESAAPLIQLVWEEKAHSVTALPTRRTLFSGSRQDAKPGCQRTEGTGASPWRCRTRFPHIWWCNVLQNRCGVTGLPSSTEDCWMDSSHFTSC